MSSEHAELIAEVEEWIADDPDPSTAKRLRELLDAKNFEQLKKHFSGFLQFGTAGLRGPIGPGPSSMNRAVVGRAAAGLANFMKEHGLTSVVIGRDARHGSEDFTFESAEIMSGAGMKVFVLPRPLPTPVLAFAVKNLGVDVGVMVTASHNPPQDNGYKVYLGGTIDGIDYRASQIVPPTDIEISREISLITSLASQPRCKDWEIVNESVVHSYVSRTAALVSRPSDLKVVYTAMHGVGTETLQHVFHKAGYASPILVQSQSAPDPDFPTVPFPNPEEPGAIDLALETARNFGADLVIANDPDADRCAAAVNDPAQGWRMLRGDELGALLGEYIASKSSGGILANSIVSSSILKKIATYYSMEYRETLTGFKWLAKIKGLTFGYEEAIGYCVDSETVNDKDGISAALVLTQLASELKRDGRTLLDLLNEIWIRYGYHGTEQISVRVDDMAQIATVLNSLRSNPPESIANYQVLSMDDLMKPKDKLPPTDGLRFWLKKDIRVIIRPSGTEAKMKCYLEVITDKGAEEAQKILNQLRAPLSNLLISGAAGREGRVIQ
ncbi:MAG TPA: phospho-sugar mutase [Candidatus Paceibacterota bacterium]|nr:phospho-sugar mutase [Candidatus Paceibacterota bacterium]